MKKPLLIGIALVIIAGGAFLAIRSSSEENKTALPTPTPQEVGLEKDAETPVNKGEITIDTVLYGVDKIVDWQGSQYSRATILWNTENDTLKLDAKGYIIGERLGTNEMELKNKHGEIQIYLRELGFEHDMYNVGSGPVGTQRSILRLGNIGCELYLRDDSRKESRDLGFICSTLSEELVVSESTPMSEKKARSIAETSECVSNGILKDIAIYNESTKTWWIDLDIDKPGCNPACVVSEDESAEINWRCTGLIEE